MKIGDWKTRSFFDRYNNIDEANLAGAARGLDEKRELGAGAEGQRAKRNRHFRAERGV